MRTFSRVIAVVTFVAGSVLVGSVSTASAAPSGVEAGSSHGCPSGAVCIYPKDTGWNGGHPSDVFYSYGVHKLENQFGTHRVFNNQTGGAQMRNCKGVNGTDCLGFMDAGYYVDENMTPINSVVLLRP